MTRAVGVTTIVEMYPSKEEDSIVAMEGVLIDITVLEQAERALRESEERFQSICENTPVMLHSIDADGRLIFVSGYWLTALGYEKHEVIGRKSTDFFTEASRQYAESEVIPAFFSRGFCRDVPSQMLKKNGEVIDVLVSAMITRNPDGTIKHSLTVLTDVTERRRVEQRNTLLAQTLRSAHDCITITDLNANIMFANDAFLTTYGYSEDEVRDKNIAMVRVPEEGSKPDQAILDVTLEDGWHGELLNRRKDGTLFPVEMWTSIVKDNAGKRIVAIEVARDISERKGVEEALAASERRYRSLFEHMLEGYAFLKMVYDDRERPKDFICLDVNSSFKRITGLKDVIGKPVSEVIPGIWDSNTELLEMCGRVALTGGPERSEVDFTPLGKWLAVSVYSPQKGCVVVVFDDITGRKLTEQASERAQEQLARSREEYKMLFDEAPIGYHEIDVEGRLTRVNRTELAMLGYDEGEMLGRHVWEFILDRESSHGSVLAKLSGEMKAGSNYERTFVRKDGAKIDVMVEDFFLYGGGGNITGIRSVLQDITERKMTEDALRHALKMESLGLLAGGVAHDFSNILYVILGNTSLAMKRLTTSHAAYANVQKAQSAAHHGVHIIKQLLACSGNGKVSMKPMSMNNLLRENGSLLDIVVQKNVRMVMDLLPSIPPIVGDEGQLQQVVMNLIINAAEAIGTKPGTILCRTWMEDVESVKGMEWLALDQSSVPGRFVMLEIRDDGIGMSQETLKRIFDPYFTTKRTGRGLGLSAFIGIIKGHHGGFRVQTEPSKGTAFQVALPAFSSQVAATPGCPMHGSKKKMGGCHVITIR